MAKKKSCPKSKCCKKQCGKKSCTVALPENKSEQVQAPPTAQSNFFLELIRKIFGYYK
jgi:hypothetical protein